MIEPVVVDPETVARECWDDPVHGRVSWRTLISADRTKTAELICGIANFPSNGMLNAHRHVQAEIVHVLSGHGTATVAGAVHDLKPGITVFVPGNATHAFAAGPDGLTLYYVFATASFSDIEYVFENLPATP